jgi:flagellar hook-associated protein 2
MGTSAYSQDLQNVINRSVAIADLPVQLLVGQENTLNSQSTELTTIDGLVGKLQTAVQGIQTAMGGSSYTADISNTSLVSASLADGAQEGVYPIEIESIGSYASGATSADWGTPAKGSTFSLVVGGHSYAITTTDTSASGVATAINQQYGNLVQATVLNAGSGSSSDTRIALQAASLGPQSLDIQDSSGNSLFNQSVAGTQAEYTVPGTGAAPVFTNSRQVVISPGITLTMLAASPGNPADVTVVRSTSALSDAVSGFADAYNAVVDEIGKQRGQNAGPLQGNSILQSISQALTSMSTYSATSGSVSGLSQLGLDLGTDGHLTYTMLTLAGTDISNSNGVNQFLGSSTTGGFLQAATNAMTGLEDPTTGLIKNTEDNMKSQLADLLTTITTKQAAVDQLQTNLEAQMSAADALLATSEQQYNYMNQMFTAMQDDAQLYK